MIKPMFWLARMKLCLMSLAFLALCTGCAVHYFDAENNIEHIWGIGHMAMKVGVPHEGVKAVGRRTDIAGVAFGRLEEGVHFEVGWCTRQRIEVVEEDTALWLAWPQGSSFYNACVGSGFPTAPGDSGSSPPKEEREQ